jgi:CDP-diacylglycerol--serine O-phosphatidyltransferase
VRLRGRGGRTRPQRTPNGFLPDRRGGVLDFLDGFLARLLKAYSPIGKELDSLADMVTFGLLPSIIVFRLMGQSLQGNEYDLVTYSVVPHVAFVIAVFSALRLAKFNVDPGNRTPSSGCPRRPTPC